MKRLVDLTADDLVAHPVWRYEGGVGKDAIVVPASKTTLSRSDDEIFLAGTDFELFDTTKHFGFCFPADDTGIAYLQPVIVTRSGPVSFWFDESPSDDKLAKQWKLLGKDETEIFPATFRCRVLVDGRIVTGRITGVESAEPVPRDASDEPRRVGIGTGEKRTSRRRPAEMAVEFTQDTLYGTGVTSDISRRGMFVRTTRTPGTGPIVRLTVHLPEGRKLFLTGKVVRSARAGPGFGLRLSDEWPNFEDLFPRRRK